MKYSNPRKFAEFTDWPYGNKRCKCQFHVEQNKGKMRAVRLTSNPKTGAWNKPKKTTYTLGVLFMDGDDGRIYIVNDAGFMFSILKSDMKLSHETIHKGDEGYEELAEAFSLAYGEDQ